MIGTTGNRQRGKAIRPIGRAFSSTLLLWLGFGGGAAWGQISFTTAVDFALRNSPKVQMAQANVEKARAALSETTDAYIPNLSGGSGLGYSYGFPLGQPTLYNFASQSLVFNASQKDLIRAAHAGIEAALQNLREVRGEVAEDAAITYLSLSRIQSSQAAMDEEYGDAQKLAEIVEARLEAGREPRLELARARRTSAQIRLQRLLLNDDEAVLRDHLARLIGLTGGLLQTAAATIPNLPPMVKVPRILPDSPGVQAAFANARAKQEIAFGDAKYAFRPQVYFAANYSRFSTFNNYQQYYNYFQYNAAAIGVQVTVPFFDRQRRSKARESAADAAYAQREAVDARNQSLEGRFKLEKAVSELQARLDLADIDQDIAQQQLEATLAQMNAAPSDAAPGTMLTPKDEQNARIQERQRYIDLQDAAFQLRKTRINLMRQTGDLESWLKTAVQTQDLAPPPRVAGTSTPGVAPREKNTPMPVTDGSR